jgi:hypothetical protein
MSAPQDNRYLYWHLLSHDEQIEAVKRMAGNGTSFDTIASATGTSPEQIKQIVEARGCDGCDR